MKKKYTNSEIIEKFNKVHNNKYDYSKVEYINSQTKVCIICPEHGEFWQTPNHHLNGRGCPLCKGRKISESKKCNSLIFSNEAKEIHNHKYDYSKVVYVNCNTKVCIICPEHGEFWQTPRCHLRGSGCPECGKISTQMSHKMTTEEFIQKAREIHCDKYDYTKVTYKNNREKIIIICPIHGEFSQSPSKHLSGQGCPKCYGNIKKTTEDFIAEATNIHGNEYDYSKTNYNGINAKVEIICFKHGSFFQTPKNHLKGQGCPECAKLKISKSETKPFKQIIKGAHIIHKQKYNYCEDTYVSSRDKMKIICPEHGEFWQTPDSHLRGCGCPKCVNIISKPETDISEFIKTFSNEEIVNNTRNIIAPLELDIYIPSKKVAIEYNGLKWHSEEFNKDRNYHLVKLNKCNEQGIKLIQIFEDEWLEHKEIVLSKIKHLLKENVDLPKVFARKCVIKEIDKNMSKDFLEKNHIQGFSASTVYLGGFYNNELVGVMTFKKENKEENNRNWELTRFATDINKHCIGIGGKIFSYFIQNYDPDYIKSFADRRWTLDKDNNLYTKLGFKLDNILKPDYRYFCQKEYGFQRVHKFNFRKHTLLKRYSDCGLTEDMTEYEMTQKLGVYRIWDCVLFKYVWKKTK